jgi:hypothetical protein
LAKADRIIIFILPHLKMGAIESIAEEIPDNWL